MRGRLSGVREDIRERKWSRKGEEERERGRKGETREEIEGSERVSERERESVRSIDRVEEGGLLENFPGSLSLSNAPHYFAPPKMRNLGFHVRTK